MGTPAKWILRLRFLLYLPPIVLSVVSLVVQPPLYVPAGIALALIAFMEFLVWKARRNRIARVLATVMLVVLAYIAWVSLVILGPGYDDFS